MEQFSQLSLSALLSVLLSVSLAAPLSSWHDEFLIQMTEFDDHFGLVDWSGVEINSLGISNWLLSDHFSSTRPLSDLSTFLTNPSNRNSTNVPFGVYENLTISEFATDGITVVLRYPQVVGSFSGNFSSFLPQELLALESSWDFRLVIDLDLLFEGQNCAVSCQSYALTINAISVSILVEQVSFNNGTFLSIYPASVQSSTLGFSVTIGIDYAAAIAFNATQLASTVFVNSVLGSADVLLELTSSHADLNGFLPSISFTDPDLFDSNNSITNLHSDLFLDSSLRSSFSTLTSSLAQTDFNPNSLGLSPDSSKIDLIDTFPVLAEYLNFTALVNNATQATSFQSLASSIAGDVLASSSSIWSNGADSYSTDGGLDYLNSEVFFDVSFHLSSSSPSTLSDIIGATFDDLRLFPNIAGVQSIDLPLDSPSLTIQNYKAWFEFDARMGVAVEYLSSSDTHSFIELRQAKGCVGAWSEDLNMNVSFGTPTFQIHNGSTWFKSCVSMASLPSVRYYLGDPQNFLSYLTQVDWLPKAAFESSLPFSVSSSHSHSVIGKIGDYDLYDGITSPSNLDLDLSAVAISSLFSHLESEFDAVAATTVDGLGVFSFAQTPNWEGLIQTYLDLSASFSSFSPITGILPSDFTVQMFALLRDSFPGTFNSSFWNFDGTTVPNKIGNVTALFDVADYLEYVQTYFGLASDISQDILFDDVNYLLEVVETTPTLRGALHFLEYHLPVEYTSIAFSVFSVFPWYDSVSEQLSFELQFTFSTLNSNSTLVTGIAASFETLASAVASQESFQTSFGFSDEGVTSLPSLNPSLDSSFSAQIIAGIDFLDSSSVFLHVNHIEANTIATLSNYSASATLGDLVLSVANASGSLSYSLSFSELVTAGELWLPINESLAFLTGLVPAMISNSIDSPLLIISDDDLTTSGNEQPRLDFEISSLESDILSLFEQLPSFADFDPSTFGISNNSLVDPSKFISSPSPLFLNLSSFSSDYFLSDDTPTFHELSDYLRSSVLSTSSFGSWFIDAFSIEGGWFAVEDDVFLRIELSAFSTTHPEEWDSDSLTDLFGELSAYGPMIGSDLSGSLTLNASSFASSLALYRARFEGTIDLFLSSSGYRLPEPSFSLNSAQLCGEMLVEPLTTSLDFTTDFLQISNSSLYFSFCGQTEDSTPIAIGQIVQGITHSNFSTFLQDRAWSVDSSITGRIPFDSFTFDSQSTIPVIVFQGSFDSLSHSIDLNLNQTILSELTDLVDTFFTQELTGFVFSLSSFSSSLTSLWSGFDQFQFSSFLSTYFDLCQSFPAQNSHQFNLAIFDLLKLDYPGELFWFDYDYVDVDGIPLQKTDDTPFDLTQYYDLLGDYFLPSRSFSANFSSQDFGRYFSRSTPTISGFLDLFSNRLTLNGIDFQANEIGLNNVTDVFTFDVMLAGSFSDYGVELISEFTSTLETMMSGLGTLSGILDVMDIPNFVSVDIPEVDLSIDASIENCNFQVTADLTSFFSNPNQAPSFSFELLSCNAVANIAVSDYSASITLGSSSLSLSEASFSAHFEISCDENTGNMVANTSSLEAYLPFSLSLNISRNWDSFLTGMPGIILMVDDDDLLDNDPPTFGFDVMVTGSLASLVEEIFSSVSSLGVSLNESSVLTTNIPLLEDDLNGLLPGYLGWGDFLFWNSPYEAFNSTCISDGSTACTLSSLFSEFQAYYDDLLSMIPSIPFISLIGSVERNDLGNFILELSFKSEATFTYDTLAFLGDLVDEQDFQFDLDIPIEFYYSIDMGISKDLSDFSSSSVSVTLTTFEMSVSVTADLESSFTFGIIDGSAAGLASLEASFESSLTGGPTVNLDSLSLDISTPEATAFAWLSFSVEVLGEPLIGGSGDAPNISVTIPDVFDSFSPVVTYSNMDDLFSFRGLTPASVVLVLRRLAQTMKGYNEEDFMQLPLPFTDATLSDAVDFGSSFVTYLTDPFVEFQPYSERDSLVIELESPVYDSSLTNSDFTLILTTPDSEYSFPMSFSSAQNSAITSAGDDVEAVADVLNELLYDSGAFPVVYAVALNDSDGLRLMISTRESIQADCLTISIPGGGTAFGWVDEDASCADEQAKFKDINGFLQILLSALPTVDEVALNATYSPAASELVFSVEFDDSFSTPDLDFLASMDLSPVADFSASATLGMTANVSFSMGLGFRLNIPPENITIIGTFPTGYTNSNFTLAEEVSFTVFLEDDSGVKYRDVVTIPAFPAPSPYSRADSFLGILEQQCSDAPGLPSAAITAWEDTKYGIYGLTTQDYRKFGTTIDTNSSGFGATSDNLIGLATELKRSPTTQLLLKDLTAKVAVEVVLSDAFASAKFGFVEFTVGQGDGVLGASFELSFLNEVTISELMAAISNVSSPFDVLSVDIQLWAGLVLDEISVELAGFEAEVPLVNITLNDVGGLRSGLLLTSTDDVTNLISEIKNNSVWNIDSDSLALLSIKDLDFGAIIDLLQMCLQLLTGDEDSGQSGLLDNSALDFTIPFIGINIGDLADFATDFLNAVEKLADNPSNSLKEFELMLESELGLKNDSDSNCVGSCVIEFSLVDTNGSHSLWLDIVLETSFLTSASFDLDLFQLFDQAGIDVPDFVSDLIDIQGSLTAEMSGGVIMTLELEMNLDSMQLLLRSGTGVELYFSAAIELVDTEVLLGPLTITVDNGLLAIDADGTGDDTNPASVRIGLDDDYTLSQALDFFIQGGLSDALTWYGGAGADFELSYSGIDLPMAFSIPDLKAFQQKSPNSVIAEGADDLISMLNTELDALNPLAVILQSPTALIDGFDSVLQQIQTALLGTGGIIKDIRLPLIGGAVSNALKTNAAFIEKFRKSAVSVLRNKVAEIMGGEEESLATVVQGALDLALGENGLNLFYDCSDNCTLMFVKDDEGNDLHYNDTSQPVPDTADRVEWLMLLGETFNPSFDPSFDFGIDGVPLELSLSGKLLLDITWKLRVGFGISLKNGFYFTTDPDEDELEVTITLTPSADLSAEGRLFFLTATASEFSGTELTGGLHINIENPADDSMVTLASIKREKSRLFSYSIGVEASLYSTLTLGTTESWIPSIEGRLEAAFAVLKNSDDPRPFFFKSAELKGVALDIRQLAEGIINPVFGKLDTIIDPVKDVVDVLGERIPVLSDMAGRTVTLLDVPDILASGIFPGSSGASKFKSVTKMITTLADLIDLLSVTLDVIDSIEETGTIPFGDFRLIWSNGTSISKTTLPAATVSASSPANADERIPDTPANANSKSMVRQFTSSGSSFEFPLLKDPGLILGLITGEDVDLIVFKAPELTLTLSFEFGFLIYSPPNLWVKFTGEISATVRFAFGFDTSGIRKAITTGNPLLALDGFFVSDNYYSGNDAGDLAELTVSGAFGPMLEFDAGIIKAGIGGTIGFVTTADLYDPNRDMKIRVSEMIAIVSSPDLGPLDLFEIQMDLACFTCTVYLKLCFPIFGCSTIFRESWGPECLITIVNAPASLGEVGYVSNSRILTLYEKQWDVLWLTSMEGAAGDEQIEVGYSDSGDDTPTFVWHFPNLAGISTGATNDDVRLYLVKSPIEVIGSGSNTLHIHLEGLGERFVGVLDQDSLSGTGIGTITYSNFATINIYLTSNDDELSIQGTGATAVVTGGDGGDTYTFARAAELGNGDLMETFTSSVVIVEDSSADGNDFIEIYGYSSLLSLTCELWSNLIQLSSSAHSISVTFDDIEELEIHLGQGDDFFYGHDTSDTMDYLRVYGRSGSDTLELNGADYSIGVNVSIDVSGAGPDTSDYSSQDTLRINASSDGTSRDVSLGSIYLYGMALGSPVGFERFGILEIYLGDYSDTFNFTDTHFDTTILYAGRGDDVITVTGIKGDTEIWGEAGNDVISAPFGTEINGEKLQTLNAPLWIDAGGGRDEIYVQVAGLGSAQMYINGSFYNTLYIEGTDLDDRILFRSSYVAILHEDTDSTERIDWTDRIDIVHVFGNAGNDEFSVDDNVGSTYLYGGKGDDAFYFGQMYNSPRDADANLTEDDWFDTTQTTRGYLSNGCRFPLTANGDDGNDFFVVLRNLATLDLNGDDGDDKFVVRAFLLVDDEGNEIANSSSVEKNTTVAGGAGNDLIEYTVNAPVDIDGGEGFDTIVVITTEAPDEMVVTWNGIFGAGLFVTFTNVEEIELATLEGDDEIYILGTYPSLSYKIYTGYGSDTVYVTPRSGPDYVVSNDLKGHSGIIEHSITSADPRYTDIFLEGISAHITDADEAGVMVIETEAEHILHENSDEYFEYSIVLSSAPTETVKIVISTEITAPISIVPDIIFFTPTNYSTEKVVRITAETGLNASSSDGNMVFSLSHAPTTDSEEDDYHALAIRSVAVRVIDNIESHEPMEVVVVYETDGESMVSEHPTVGDGLTDSYFVEVYPCISGVTVTPVFNSSQLDSSSLAPFTTTSSVCTKEFTLIALYDAYREGNHFVTITHEVSGSSGGRNWSAIQPNFVTVEVFDYDDNAAGIILREQSGSTDLLEGGNSDTYFIRLSAPPVSGTSVVISPSSVPTRTYNDNGVATSQLDVSPASLTFDDSNWEDWQTVTVSAPRDYFVDGKNLQVFPPQPSQVQWIQGPIEIDGADDPEGVGSLPYPNMLPWETMEDVYECDIDLCPYQVNLYVDEFLQHDTLVIGNSDGYRADTLVVDSTQFTGLGMGEDKYLSGEFKDGGIIYGNFEEIVIDLGPSLDTVIIKNSSQIASTYINTADGSDTAYVESITGHVFFDMGNDDDYVLVTSNNRLNQIDGLLVINGGEGTSDTVLLDNSQDSLDNHAILTNESITELDMKEVGGDILQLVYAVRVLDPLDFSLIIDNGKEVTFSYGVSAKRMQALFQAELFDNSSCGWFYTSPCAPSIQVDLFDETYFLTMSGEIQTLRGYDLVTAGSVGNVNIVQRTEGINYYFVDYLTIEFGSADDTLNIQGTSSDSTETHLNLNNGDDAIYISSASLLDVDSSRTIDYLSGHLDWVDGEVFIDMGRGRHIMMISDENTSSPKTGVLSSSYLSGISSGTIHYSCSASATIADGITLWLGPLGDELSVISTHKRDSVRTTTTVNAGTGNDEITVSLIDNQDGFFVVNGEEDEDVIDARSSSLPLVILGGLGSDQIFGGSSQDLIFGDIGKVYYADGARIGGAGPGDFTDGVIRNATSLMTDVVLGSHDQIESNDGNDIILCGTGDDEASGGTGNDLLIGDHGTVFLTDTIVYYVSSDYQSIDGNDVLYGGTDLDILFGSGADDTLDGQSEDDVLIGDFGTVNLTNGIVFVVSSNDTQNGGDDTLNGGSDDDILLGGVGKDTISGDSANDVILGDLGIVNLLNGKASVVSTLSPQFGDSDDLSGNDGMDLIIGGPGVMDSFSGGMGEDVLLGDAGWANFTFDLDGNIVVDVVFSTDHDSGGSDDMKGDEDDDLLIGGSDSDLLKGGDGEDVILGDEAWAIFTLDDGRHVVDVAYTTVPDSGAADEIFGERGDDILIGGSQGDTIWGGFDEDVILGDQGYYERTDLIIYVIDPTYGGSDHIYGYNGDDVIFGGTGDDFLYGDSGSDIILGDHGFWNKSEHILNHPHQSYISTYRGSSDGAGDDTIYGGAGDDFLIGCQGSDEIYGDEGDDDIIGGHNVLFGHDEGDVISGGDGADCILGDNAIIYRNAETITSSYKTWELHPDPFPDVIRTIGQFDDYECRNGSITCLLHVGDDTLSGDDGDDLIWGQRGDDTISGGNGSDELIGGFGSDTISGGGSRDFILGDVGHFLRATCDDSPCVNPDGSWHRDVALEETVSFLGKITPTSPSRSIQDISLIFDSDLLLTGAYFSGNAKALNSLGEWDTAVFRLQMSEAFNDALDGGDGDDFICGQRGNDLISGGGGDDLLLGDTGHNVLPFDSELMPHIVTIFRALEMSSDSPFLLLEPTQYNLPDNIPFGTVFASPIMLTPEQYAFQASPLSILFRLPVAEVFGSQIPDMHVKLGIDDLAQTSISDPVFRPYVTLVPDILRHPESQFGNDEIVGGEGDDIVVGDRLIVHTFLNLLEIDNYLTSGIDFAWSRLISLAHRLVTISTDFERYQSSIGTTYPEKTEMANDILDGSGGNDIIFGDDALFLGDAIMEPSWAIQFPDFDSAATLLYEYFRDVELIASDLEFFLYEGHTALLSDSLFTNMNMVASPTHNLSVCNDQIIGGTGSDIIYGDFGLFLFPNVNNSEFVAFSDHSSMKSLRDQREDYLTDHISASFTPLTSPVNERDIFGEYDFFLEAGNDVVDGGDESDIIVGDFGFLVTSIINFASFGNDYKDLDQHLDKVLQAFWQLFIHDQYFLDQNANPSSPFDDLVYYSDRGDRTDGFLHADVLSGGNDDDFIASDVMSLALPFLYDSGSFTLAANKHLNAHFGFPAFGQFFDSYTRDYDIDTIDGGPGNDICTSRSEDSDINVESTGNEYSGNLPKADQEFTGDLVFAVLSSSTEINSFIKSVENRIDFPQHNLTYSARLQNLVPEDNDWIYHAVLEDLQFESEPDTSTWIAWGFFLACILAVVLFVVIFVVWSKWRPQIELKDLDAHEECDPECECKQEWQGRSLMQKWDSFIWGSNYTTEAECLHKPEQLQSGRQGLMSSLSLLSSIREESFLRKQASQRLLSTKESVPLQQMKTKPKPKGSSKSEQKAEYESESSKSESESESKSESQK